MTSTDKVIEQIAQIIFDNVSGPTFFDRSIQDEHERDVDKAARLIHATLADTLEAERAENQRLRATLSAITATDCYSRDECTAMARAALNPEASHDD